MIKYKPRFGKISPGHGSKAVGNYMTHEGPRGKIVQIQVQLTMGDQPQILGDIPYIRLPFHEVKIGTPWTVHFVARNHKTNEAHNIKGFVNGDLALVDIAQEQPFRWDKGDTLFMATMYQYDDQK